MNNPQKNRMIQKRNLTKGLKLPFVSYTGSSIEQPKR